MMTSSPWISRAARLMLVLAAAACGGDSNGPSNALFTVSGSLTNRTGHPIPSTAHVVVIWTVTATPTDYSYVFGQGTVQGGKFQVAFRHLPPAEALNAGQLGVGIVFLTTNTDLVDGVHVEDVAPDPSELLGATGRYAVIYKATDVVDQVDWEGAFPLGWSAGVGVDRVGNFDAFAPTPPTALELIVDDLSNIDFVEWT